LGDFAYRCDLAYAAAVLARLEGRTRLVRSKHDRTGERLG
jgi:calcineurin-like phosphoesterase family protein